MVMAKADTAQFFRPSTGNLVSATPNLDLQALPGEAAYKTGDDGDGKADIALFRPAMPLVSARRRIDRLAIRSETDLPVPADYDGDGKTDLAVFRNGTWYLQRSQAGFESLLSGRLINRAYAVFLDLL